jgi:hypothetical protein
MNEFLTAVISLLIGFGLGISNPLLGDWIKYGRKL